MTVKIKIFVTHNLHTYEVISDHTDKQEFSGKYAFHGDSLQHTIFKTLLNGLLVLNRSTGNITVEHDITDAFKTWNSKIEVLPDIEEAYASLQGTGILNDILDKAKPISQRVSIEKKIETREEEEVPHSVKRRGRKPKKDITDERSDTTTRAPKRTTSNRIETRTIAGNSGIKKRRGRPPGSKNKTKKA